MLQKTYRAFQTDLMGSACPKLIRLDFNDLTGFERVTDQYQTLGVQFSGALALQPSNPAFLPKSGTVVLMPSGHEMILTARFERPTFCVGVWVCGAGSVTLTAFDSQEQLVDRISTETNSLVELDNLLLINSPQQMEVCGREIARVEFHSTVPFILDDFFFTQTL